MTTATQTATTCPHCRGNGEVGTWVEWSDGLGGSSATCPLCDGAKTIDFDPARKLVELKTALNAFLYKVWLVAGCYPVMQEVSGLQPHEQGLRNEVLRMVMELGGYHVGCKLDKPESIMEKERQKKAEIDARRAKWRQEREAKNRRYL